MTKWLVEAQWLIDGKIDLTETVNKEGWHRLSSIDALVEQGLSRRDAESYVCFLMEENAGEERPEENLDDAQRARLTLKKS